MPFVTQSINATVSARMVSLSGFGLAGSTQPFAAAVPLCALNPPRPPPCVVPGEEVAANVVRQRNVGLGVRADQVRRFAQIPEFQRSEGLENLRAGLGGACSGPAGRRSCDAARDPRNRSTRGRLRCPAGREPRTPPATAKRKLSASCRAAMCGFAPSHTMRPASSWLKPRWIKLRMKLPDCESPRLITHSTRPASGLSAVSSLGIPQKRVQVARGGVADAHHQRVLGGIHQDVFRGRVEAVLHTNLRGIGRAGERRPGAIGECPVGGGNGRRPARSARFAAAGSPWPYRASAGVDT